MKINTVSDVREYMSKLCWARHSDIEIEVYEFDGKSEGVHENIELRQDHRIVLEFRLHGEKGRECFCERTRNECDSCDHDPVCVEIIPPYSNGVWRNKHTMRLLYRGGVFHFGKSESYCGFKKILQIVAYKLI